MSKCDDCENRSNYRTPCMQCYSELEKISNELYNAVRWTMECIVFDETMEEFRQKIITIMKKYEEK
jgi:hypothetical protein